jgi:F-box protein 9
MEQTEAELERFRREWRNEVSARTRTRPSAIPQAHTSAGASSSSQARQRKSHPPLPKQQYPRDAHEGWDEIEPRSYHDLEEKATGRRVGDETGRLSPATEPTTALEHYEKAVEREGQGNLGDSVSLYRKAFKLDARVHEKYKNKHFPAGSFQHHSKPQNPNPSNASMTVPNTAHHSLTTLPASISDLIAEFSKVSIAAEPPPTELSPAPPCPIATVPEEILTQILLCVAGDDVASFARLAKACKRLAFLVISEDSVWRRVTLGREFGFAAMHYRYACTVMGKPLSSADDGQGNFTLDTSPLLSTQEDRAVRILPLSPSYPTYRHMFRLRPRVRFNGCYISTVNYTRPGAASNNWTWNAPVLIVTYFRYLRFFRDGTVISLLTTSEPADVVPYLHKEHLRENHSSNLPQSVMRDALRGRWRLSGDPYCEKLKATDTEDDEEPEDEGDLLIETEGVVPRYLFKMHLALKSAGRGARNNKLLWKGFWSHNKLTDDWAEFGLKHYQAFYWSRVKSYDTWE